MWWITINASVPQNQQTEIITYDQGKWSSKKGTWNPAILEKFSGKKPNNKQEDWWKWLWQKKFLDEVWTTLSWKKQPDLHYTFKKGGKEEWPSTKSVVSTDTNKDPVQVLSKIIVDALTPDHIKYAKGRSPLKVQQKLYENVFHITGPFQHISTAWSSKKILKIYIGNDFEAAKIIKSLSLLDQLDYDTYGIDEIALVQDSPKAQKKLDFVKGKMEEGKNNNKNRNNKDFKESSKNKDKERVEHDLVEYYNMIWLEDYTDLDDSVNSTGLDDLVVVYSSSTDQENIINDQRE